MQRPRRAVVGAEQAARDGAGPQYARLVGAAGFQRPVGGAFTLADGIAYVEAALARGLAIDDFAPRLSFFFAAWSELFEEVAKFRAARRIWARVNPGNAASCRVVEKAGLRP